MVQSTVPERILLTGATGAIFGVGSVRNASAVRWGLARSIVMAWVFTIPATALIAALFYAISLQLF